MQTNCSIHYFILVIGIFALAGCRETGSGITNGNGNGNGGPPLNNVYFTVEGEEADAEVEILKNGIPLFSGLVGPQWESTVVSARRNDVFLLEICNSVGHGFEFRMFLNGEEITVFFHSGDPNNNCSEKTVTLDQTYDDLLYD